MAGKLTEMAVKSAKPAEKRYTLFDTGSLYLEVAPNGSKWWRFRYRINGKQKVMSFGVYPDVGLKNARDKRDAARTLLANGGDPLGEKKDAEKPFRTFDSVLEEWFEHRKREWAPSYIKTMRLRVDRYLHGKLPDKPFSELEVPDFLSIIREIEKRGTFETARKIVQICGQVCRYARLSGIIKSNPIEGIVEILTPYKQEHFKTIIDPVQIGQLLRDIQYYPGRPSTGFALRIMPYVFVRSQELRGVRWSEINFDTATWVIPPERMKMRREHIVPLATQVVKLFNDLKFFTGSSELCFPSPMSNTVIWP